MRKSKLSHKKSRERTGTHSGRRRKPSGSKGPKPSTNLEARISADPEVLSLLTEITRDESRLRKSGSLKSRGRKKSPTKGRTVRLEGGIEVDDSVLSFLSPSEDAPTNRSFSTRLTSRRSDFVLDSARFESSETKGSSKTSRHPKSTRISNRSGRQSKQVPSSRNAATGRRSHRPGKAAAAPAPARKVQASPPVKKGAAGLLDLSEISKGLEQPGTSYQLDFGERMAEAMASELKSIYANNAQYWLPRTEQTIINERMALERKLQRQIQGLE